MATTKPYELTAILSGQSTPEQVNAWQNDLGLLVGKWDGRLVASQNLGSRTLGYRIRRKDTGYERTGIAIVTQLELPSNAPALLHRALATDAAVLRIMLSRPKPRERERLDVPSVARAQKAQEETPAAIVPQAGGAPRSPEPALETPAPMSESELDKRLEEILDVKEF